MKICDKVSVPALKHRRTGRHFTEGEEKIALKITIFPKNKQFAQLTRITPNWTYWIFTAHTVYWKIFSPFRIFQQLALALRNRVCPEIFHCIEYTSYIQDFLAICACLEKQCAVNSLHLIYFFYHSGFLNNLRLPWNRVFPENFQARGASAPPPRLVCLCLKISRNMSKNFLVA